MAIHSRTGRIVVLGMALLVASACGRDPSTSTIGPSTERTHRPESSSILGWELLRADAASEVEHYETLDEMTGSADVVVHARVTRVGLGRTFGSEIDKVYYAKLLLDIVKVLAGSPDANESSLILELLLPGPEVLEELDRYLIGDEGIFFLRNKGREAAAQGWNAEAQEQERRYYRFVSSQGLFLSADGITAIPLYPDEGFPAELAGMDFTDATQAVEAAS